MAMRSVLQNAARFCLLQRERLTCCRTLQLNSAPCSRDRESSRLLQNWFGALGRQRKFHLRSYDNSSAPAPAAALTLGSRVPQAGELPSFMYGVLRNGKRRVSYLLAAVAATGCLGTGLFVVLADAGREDGRRPTVADAADTLPKKKKVVVLGIGWAGTSFLKHLDSTQYDVSVVAPRNCFVFTPLLPSVASGTVEARSITEPIRRIIRKTDVQFYQSECAKIDAKSKRILCKHVSEMGRWEGDQDFTLDYDLLVVAVGATNNTFGSKGVQEYCHFLKEIEDAEKIRDCIVERFETAGLPNFSSDERRKLLHFVVVGGGPTGVEYAAELHDLIHEDLSRLYPSLEKDATITVVQSADHILNSFDRRISEYAEKKFARDGVDVKIGSRVSEVTDKCICLKSKNTGNIVQQMPYGMVVWSTGIGTRPVVTDFMAQIGQGDRRVLATDQWLQVANCEGVYALGDCASIEQQRICDDVINLFELADKGKSGFLTAEEFVETVDQVRSLYPQIDTYLEHEHMQGVTGLLDNAIKDGKQSTVQLDLKRFGQAVCKVDSQLKSMPATAQVADQQGVYLARCFNKLAKDPTNIDSGGHHKLEPFHYRHLGEFAPLGGEVTAAELPGDWVSIGHSTQWLWYSVYASLQLSWRTRVLVVFDWTKKFIFGRDSSRM
ncbi:unnamed protein product [Sphagnum jensenii]|uniref:NADH:ubiquinone reductase (non-electrogenic) n=1 Tax=Sphagnum jensenii TaxID=128206 RepID=A0ABP1A2K5_9BRYO